MQFVKCLPSSSLYLSFLILTFTSLILISFHNYHNIIFVIIIVLAVKQTMLKCIGVLTQVATPLAKDVATSTTSMECPA